MTRKLMLPFLVILAALLAACASATPAPQPLLATKSASDSANASPPPAATEALAPASQANADPSAGAEQDLARTDAQNAVEFVVTPLNLSSSGETLDFDVSMDTHSVDLSWDLAAQSVLSTDTGLEVNGVSWPVGGGHHFEGTLTFPAKTADGQPLLDGAKTLTLIIKDAAAPERLFVWELAK